MVSHGSHFLPVKLQWFPWGLGEANFANYAYKHGSFSVIFSMSTLELCYLKAGKLLRWTIVLTLLCRVTFIWFFFFFWWIHLMLLITILEKMIGKTKFIISAYLGYIPALSLPTHFSIQTIYPISLTRLLCWPLALPSIRALDAFILKPTEIHVANCLR